MKLLDMHLYNYTVLFVEKLEWADNSLGDHKYLPVFYFVRTQYDCLILIQYKHQWIPIIVDLATALHRYYTFLY